MKAMLAGLFLCFATAANAMCEGRNLIDALGADARAELDAATARVPYAQGNLWRATRGNSTVWLVGTYHLGDPRTEAALQRIAPLLSRATRLLVEAGPEEEARLAAHLRTHPEAIMTPADAPALADSLPPDEGDALTRALAARGVTGDAAARMRPWYAAMLLGIAPCAMGPDAAEGLDHRLIDMAKAQDIPITALEPYDTLLTLFADQSQAEQLDMIRLALPDEPASADQAVTLADAYFAADSRRMWEYLRLFGTDPRPQTETDRDYAQMEERLLSQRNRAWVPVLETHSAEGAVLAAFGALHLSGDHGVLALMHRAGFTLTRLD
ncbi:TraB/GumN family protein [Falsirhodobacter algicola]|uniref:TraB/GumN family protein n=1 Tax=Falsirhodobacter algicola TaxID=2692330 RepID=A0A8J8MT43_9RHOB|nr:TraB/GumN family protein [Falsirhodobacter algicola]QUS35763.1 TraB/GumN family protein [Falsirhodobacter algicola]